MQKTPGEGGGGGCQNNKQQTHETTDQDETRSEAAGLTEGSVFPSLFTAAAPGPFLMSSPPPPEGEVCCRALFPLTGKHLFSF